MQRPSGNKWPKLRYFILVAVVLALLGVLIVFLVTFARTNYVFRPVGNKYDILVDLLVIVLASGSLLIAAIGYGVYRLISERIERQVLAANRMNWIYWAASALVVEGLHSWEKYVETEKKQVKHLTEAVQKTEKAYNEYAIFLDEQQRDYQRLICFIRNNLGYYLAERGNPEDREFARQCAEYIQSKMLEFPADRAAWGDTTNFIFQKYPQVG